MELHAYMTSMSLACFRHMLPDGYYGRNGKEGHLRLAREMGHVLADMEGKERQDFLQASYGAIYVRACDLKPMLDGKEWVNMMLQAEEYKKEFAWMYGEKGLAWRVEQMNKEDAGEPFEQYLAPSFEEWQKNKKKRTA